MAPPVERTTITKLPGKEPKEDVRELQLRVAEVSTYTIISQTEKKKVCI
jgi:hypothetical protein